MFNVNQLLFNECLMTSCLSKSCEQRFIAKEHVAIDTLNRCFSDKLLKVVSTKIPVFL